MSSIDETVQAAQRFSTRTESDDYNLAMEQYNEMWHNTNALTQNRIKRMIAYNGGNPKSRTQRWEYMKVVLESALDDLFTKEEYRASTS